MSKNKISFSLLTEEEKMRKLGQLNNASSPFFLLWKKGDAQRYKVDSVSYNQSFNHLQIKTQTSLSDGMYCVTFDFRGVNYFLQTSLKPGTEKNNYILNCNTKLYKSERRNSYRLLTFPAYKIKVYLKVDQKPVEESNVVDFKTKLSKTSLFKNFLSVVNPYEYEKKEMGYIPFRVVDISASGMAIYVGKMEESLFQENNKLNKILLHFDGADVDIHDGEIIYKSKYVQSERNNLEVYKVGIRFVDLDFQTDKTLAKLIHEKLTDYDDKKDFEKFINQ